MTARTARRGRHALAAIAVSPPSPSRSSPSPCPGARRSRPFPHCTLRRRRPGGRTLTLPNGTAVLSYPPSLSRLAGDTDAVSAARLSPGGAFQLYLNATPRQGTERLRHWAASRLRLLRSDDAASAHQDAAAEGIKFRGGTGSCVIDDYLTRIGAHHYQEIACLVQGRTSASVIVAAAPGRRRGPGPARCYSGRSPPTSSAERSRRASGTRRTALTTSQSPVINSL